MNSDTSLGWEEVFFRKHEFIGGDIEWVENIEPNGIFMYRGPIQEIELHSDTIHFHLLWIAIAPLRPNGLRGQWQHFPNRSLVLYMDASLPRNVRAGHVRFEIPRLGSGVLYSVTGPKLDLCAVTSSANDINTV